MKSVMKKIANTDLQQQADIITKDLQKQGLDITSDKK